MKNTETAGADENMEKLFQDYARSVQAKITLISRRDSLPVRQAAAAMYQSTVQGRNIYFFGTGHSYMLSQEIFGRAGGYAGRNFRPILEEELSMDHLIKSTFIERSIEYADVILGIYDFQKGDTIVMTSNSGRNCLIVELALRLKQAGLTVIAITSAGEQVASRHPSGKKLCDVADVVIDSFSDYGDAALTLPNGERTGAMSTITGAFLINSVVVCFMEKLIANHQECPVFASSNVDAGDAHNQDYFRDYLFR